MPLPATPGFPAVATTYGPRVAPGSGGVLDESGLLYTGVSATTTLTVGGTVGAGPTVTIAVGGTAVTYTYVAGDTTTTIAATDITTALNANSTITGLATITSSTNVITITAKGVGQAGILAVTEATTGGATITLANLATATVTVTGTVGSGPTASVIVDGTTVTYTYVAGDTTTTLAAQHIAAAINANGTVNLLVAATNAANVITINTINGANHNIATNVTGGAVLTLAGECDYLSPNIVYPTSDFSYVGKAGAGFGAIRFFSGMPAEVDQGTRADLKTQGLVA